MKKLTVAFLPFAFVCTVLSSCVGLPGFISPISDDLITWSTPTLNQTECPNLNGNYLNWDKLDLSINNTFTHYNHQAEETPNVEVIKYINEPDWNLSYKQADDRRKLFTANESLLSIVQNNISTIELNIVGFDKQIYTRKIYSVVKSSPKYQVGCYKSNLIVREISHLGGVEGTAKSVGASEIKYSIEKDGSLKVITHYRNWNHYKDPTSQLFSETFKRFVEK